jgi:peptidoglycan hydrolase-like protein with peptidoglycan-binding domain
MRDMKCHLPLCAMILLITAVASSATADEVTQRIQKDLVTLGYDPGNVDGESSDATVAAIAQYQAERDMPVTGEASPLLAGIMSAEVSKKSNAAAVPARDPAALHAAQQACLQEKIAAAEASNKKKRGFGRLLSAVSRTAYSSGNSDLARTTNTVYSANATAADLSAAAEDLGLTEDEVAQCQDPP